MTPKEKAIELFDKMHWAMPHPSTTNAQTYIISKQCAIIAVDEILANRMPFEHSSVEYWQDVKQEIENL